ncbi:MAG: hypothetical protein WAM71_20015 [Candidatus Korobacteraceae bacterium]
MKCPIFCACEKVVFDKNETASLISVLQNVDVRVPVTPPEYATLPKEWFIFTRWDVSDSEPGKIFEQVWQVLWPDGEKFVEHRAPLNATSEKRDDDVRQGYFQLASFPFGQQGKMRLLTWLDFDGQRVSEIEESGFWVQHHLLPVSTEHSVA